MKRWQKILMLWVLIMILMAVAMWLVIKKNVIDNEEVVDWIPVAPTKIVEQPLKFGVMADIHLDWEELGKFLTVAKQRENDFVIIAGDMTSLGKRKELDAAKKTLEASGITYFVVPGNHDLWESARLKEPIFNEVFGRDYQSFRKGNTKYILVNNGSANGLGTIQTEWLQNEVTECRVVMCIVVMHMPLDHNFSTHVMGEGSTMVTNEAKSLVDLFNDNGVKEIISGHLHYASAYEIDGIRTSIVGAISRDRNNQTPRYTEFSVLNGVLERQLVEN